MRSRVWSLVSLCGLLCAAQVGRADEPAKFYRGINLNGPALVIDNQKWDGNDARDFECNGQGFENTKVPLKPPTDPERTLMIRSSRWGGDINVDLLHVPAGDYQAFLYVWEDNDPAEFSIEVNGRTVVPKFNSGHGGDWKRLGPWPVKVTDGKLRVSARGGHANLSGLEVWSGTGPVPDPTLDPEQVAFFEKRVRPLLVQHCYECHSAQSKKLGGGLLLDSREGIVKGGDTEPPLVAGNPESSLLMSAVRHEDASLKMPPKSKLSDAEISDLETWIKMGAPDPRTENTLKVFQARNTIDWDKARDFWSLKPASSPSIPAVQNQAWATNEIDHFILARLEKLGLPPAADADKITLLRRATFDLTGLPPTLAEVDAFNADTTPDAFAKVVDRLLQSPRYGERWGRHWLDVVRYSDTAGDNSDFPIPQMYRYRNWVIEAFNRDLPYDQFVREQLAGDLLGGDTVELAQQRLIATGYIANARRFGSRVDDYPQHLTIEDTLDNLGRTFLAMTINCARCHNHKFDPISTEDYYGLYGIFHSTRYPWPGIELEQKQRDLVPLVAAAEVQRLLAERKQKQESLDVEVKRLEKLRDAAKDDERKDLDKQVGKARNEAEKHSRSSLPFEQAYAVAEAGKFEDAAVQQKGDPSRGGDIVPRRFLTVLSGQTVVDPDKTSGRLQLANWIVDRQNPLTARVIANRLWLYHFGKGIVPTPNDFGRQGKPPTHPELLDWLAVRLMDSDWSLKSLHRTIMLSHTYRQSSLPSAAAIEKDSSNEAYSAFPRRRLDAEAIRDTLLFVSNQLDLTPGGPHPFPPQTDWKFTQHNPFKAVYDTNRRSVYLMIQRIQRHPYLAIFDGADPSASTALRMTSTTPLQALYFLNDAFIHERAQGVVERLLQERSDDAGRVELAYQLLLARGPTAEETAAGLQFLRDAQDTLRGAGAADDQLQKQSWQAFVRALFRLNEFVYVD